MRRLLQSTDRMTLTWWDHLLTLMRSQSCLEWRQRAWSMTLIFLRRWIPSSRRWKKHMDLVTTWGQDYQWTLEQTRETLKNQFIIKTLKLILNSLWTSMPALKLRQQPMFQSNNSWFWSPRSTVDWLSHQYLGQTCEDEQQYSTLAF